MIRAISTTKWISLKRNLLSSILICNTSCENSVIERLARDEDVVVLEAITTMKALGERAKLVLSTEPA